MRHVAGRGAMSPGGGFAFVGRQRELELLVGALRDPPAIVLVEGEAGIGKSRLVHEAAARAASAGAPGRVLIGLCHPLREPVPFGPVIDALSKAGPLLPAVEAIPRSAGALAAVMPDLADRLPEPPPRAEDSGGERRRMALGVRSFLTAIGPVVLVIEDVHWVDEITRELLLLLSRDMPEGLSLVLTFRADDLESGTPLLGSAFRRQPGTGGASIHLEPLSEQDVRDLAQDALGADADARLGQVLHDRSGGLPLVAEEDLITLRERCQRHASPAGAGDLAGHLEQADVPHGLRESLAERLTTLSPAGTAVVEAAAVLAIPAERTLLTQVAGLSEGEGSRGITEALGESVLRETSPDTYAFRHVLAQLVAYQTVPGPRRAHLHRQAIAVLAALSPPPLVQIAHHTLRLGDRDAWLAAAEAAADQAIELGDAGTAATLFHQILEQPRLTAEVRSRVAQALAAIAVNGVDYTTNAAVLRRILADPQLPKSTRGDIRLSLGLLVANHAGDRMGYREIARAVEELADRPERAARAMIALALNEQDGASEQAWPWMRRAEATLRECPDEAVRAAAEATRLTLMARDGNPQVWDRLGRLPRRADDPEILRQTTRALYNVGDIAIELGQDRRAAALLAESRELARRAGIPYLEAYSKIALARLQGLSGDWANVEKRFDELLDQYPDIAMVRLEQAMLVGLIAAARGQRTRARQLFNTAAALGEVESQVTSTLRASAALVAVRLAEGAIKDARTLAGSAASTLRRAGAWARGTGLVPVAVETALACGDRAFAEDLVRDAEYGLQSRDGPAAAAELRIAHGILAGGSAAAAENFDRARQLWTDIGRPYDCARATERLSFALASARPDEAVARAEEAIATYSQLGATSDVARCQHTLRDLGLYRPSARGRRGYGGQLSPRERQVADLLARGATNQDIAQALFLSPRTVEQHVARVLKKLDVARKEVGEALRTDRADLP